MDGSGHSWGSGSTPKQRTRVFKGSVTPSNTGEIPASGVDSYSASKTFVFSGFNFSLLALIPSLLTLPNPDVRYLLLPCSPMANWVPSAWWRCPLLFHISWRPHPVLSRRHCTAWVITLAPCGTPQGSGQGVVWATGFLVAPDRFTTQVAYHEGPCIATFVFGFVLVAMCKVLTLQKLLCHMLAALKHFNFFIWQW